MIPDSLLQALQTRQGWRVRSAHPLGGGCIHHAHRVETDQGRFFVKWNALNQAANFEVEAKGLHLLAGIQALQVPEVVARGSTEAHAFLALTFIESRSRAGDFWEQLGRGLARLHRHSWQQFGLDYDNYIGALPQQNTPRDEWVAFFIQHRLMKPLQMAYDAGKVHRKLMDQMEQLYPQLPALLPEEAPALIHGDLWGGNLMAGASGEPVMFDPAVYYAHREIELAFMTLFDRQPPAFYEAYEEVYPLQAGWRDRIDLYLLYPLLVHVNLFGEGYLGGIRQTLKRYTG